MESISHMKSIQSIIRESINVKETIASNGKLLETIDTVILEVVKAFKNGNKVLFCGNGGSAADAQHLAAEFSGRFYFDRAPLYSEALHVNTSFLTAVGNDYSYDEVYSRMVKGIGKPADVLFGISTSGNSKNIINAIIKANELGMTTIAMTGSTGGKLAEVSKHLINVPSSDTPRIQESHIMIGHIICEYVEANIFNK
jgi:D-sedoheptulose 7-phosphate isomerase